MLTAFTHVHIPCCTWSRTLKTAIPMPVTLFNTHDRDSTTLATSDRLTHSKHSCTFAPLLARWLLRQVRSSPRQSSPDGNKCDGLGGCLQATEAEINGSVSVCFSAAAGKQAPSCQLRYGPLKAVAQSQRWVHILYSNSCPVHRSCYGSAL